MTAPNELRRPQNRSPFCDLRHSEDFLMSLQNYEGRVPTVADN